MRIRKRLLLSLTGVLFVTTLAMISLSVHTYTEDNGTTRYDVAHGVSSTRITLQKRVFEELDKIVPPARKKKRDKRKHIRKMNVTNDDSNQAGEVELSEKEYEELWKSKYVLSPSTSPKQKLSGFQDTMTKLKSRFIHDCTDPKPTSDPDDDRDPFSDLVQILKEEKYSHEFEQAQTRNRITIQDVHEIELERNLTSMELFHLSISDQDMYREDDPVLVQLMREMAKNEIVHVEEKEGGTQLKLIVTYYDGSQAMMKPMRFDRDQETLPNHLYFVDYERHNSEIAAFHLDRILGFRRCPPVVGRKLNITTEIYAVTDEALLKTFFISPAQNYCFHGHCSYYCDTSHAICGRPDDIEGSMAAFLPPDQLSGRKSWKNPWKRTYHKRRKANWETNNNYCNTVRQQPLYKDSKRLADLIDVTILDFMIGNMDRHHYETFKIFGNDSFILHLDHGRGFGRSKHDELSILAPLYQCCFIHITTFERLLQLQLNPMRLSTLMRCSLYSDPLNPILNEAHLLALDRRLHIILQVLRECFEKKDSKKILYSGLDYTS